MAQVDNLLGGADSSCPVLLRMASEPASAGGLPAGAVREGVWADGGGGGGEASEDVVRLRVVREGRAGSTAQEHLTLRAVHVHCRYGKVRWTRRDAHLRIC